MNHICISGLSLQHGPIELRMDSNAIDNQARAIIIETGEPLDSMNRSADRFRVTLHGISIYNRGVNLRLPKYETSPLYTRTLESRDSYLTSRAE